MLAFTLRRKAGPGPFFQDRDGVPLTRGKFVKEVKKALDMAGVDSKAISGHSFRIGTATAAARCGASEADIKDLGRWRSREYRGYVWQGGGKQAVLAEGLAGDSLAGTSSSAWTNIKD